MRHIDTIIVHCSATPEGVDISAATIKQWHTTPIEMGGRGWSDIGYHYVIRLDGTIEQGRTEKICGAHCRGHNATSIGICYVGGLDGKKQAKDTRTDGQKKSLRSLIEHLKLHYPIIVIAGHRDFSPDLNGDGIIDKSEWMKECPCFDVREEYQP